MKKLLLMSAFALSTAVVTAQVIEADNYDTYTLGDVGTNFAFGAPGQGGMFLNGGSAPDYQIVNIDAAHDKSFQVTTGAGAVAADNRQAVKLGFGAAWSARTAGNDVLKATFEVYTGSSTGNVYAGTNVTNATAGIVGLRYNSATKMFVGMANLTSNATQATGFYNITGISAATFPANTWVTVGFTYDKVNGVITYTIDGVKSTLAINGYTITKNLDGSQFNVISQVSTSPANTASLVSAIDNYSVEAVNAATLGVTVVGQIADHSADVTIYPNPATDIINLKSTSKIISASIIDLSGKVVTSSKVSNNQVDVRNLSKGNYILKVETETGTVTKKFLKK